MAKMGKIKKKRPSSSQKRTLLNYDSEQVKRALAAIKSGMAVLKASKEFGVPRTTLRHKLAGTAPESSGKMGPEAVLGKEIEDDICTWVKTCAEMGFPIDRDGLRYSVKQIVTDKRLTTPFKNNVPGKTWFKSFMARHPQISLKQPEYLGKARASVTEQKIRAWFSETTNLLGNNIEVLEDPYRTWNMDETSFFLNPKGGLVLAEKGKQVYGISGNSDKENVTTLITVNAAGDLAPPLTIYKFDRLPAAYLKSAPRDWSLGKSENGWMTAKTFYEYFANVFYPFLVDKSYKLPVIVFLDGHTSHLSLQLSQFCREKQIIIVCLPPNATHILQPLDVAIFYPMKCRWRKAIKKWRYDHEGRDIKKQEVPQLLNQILKEYSFTTAIANGFRKCGLFPYNADNVDYSKCISKMDVNVNSNETNNEVSNVETFTNDIGNQLLLNHLQYLESRIDENILQQLKKHYNEKTNPGENLEALYNVWIKVQCECDDNENDEIVTIDAENENVYNEHDEIVTIHAENDDVNDTLIFPFPEFNVENRDNFEILYDDNFEVLTTTSLEENDDFKVPAVGTSTDDGNISCDISDNVIDKTNSVIPSVPSYHDSIKSDDYPITNGQATSDSKIAEQSDSLNISCKDTEPKKKIQIISNIKLNPEEKKVLGEILVFPQQPSGMKKKKGKIHLPSVLTSDQWVAIAEEKENQKQDELAKKEERKRKREETKKRNEETKKRNEEKKLSKKRSCKIDEDKNETEDIEPVIQPQTKITEKDLDINSFVIVEYEQNYYPGQIVEKKDDGYLISTMKKSGLQDWKWPDESDEIIYNLPQIKEVIPVPKKKNARGVYVVPEMEKYQEFIVMK